MNSRLILVVNNVLQRKWLTVAEVINRNLTSVTYRCREQKFYHCLHKNWDLSYSQYRSFHHSNLLYKRRKTKEERKMPKVYLPSVSKHKQKRVVEVWKNMTVKELADSVDLSVDELNEVMDYVSNTDNYYKPNHSIDNFDTLQAIVKRLGYRWLLISKKTEEEGDKNKDIVMQPPPDPSVLVKRPPVVTIMGHVDHGKTTLLDRLRNSSVVDSEFGGITQHIGAFSVLYKDKYKITFLDTPGHAAFTAMRSRGANVTDIVVLVVAADDGVMDQTKESLRMAKEAKVPIVVAINKIDKPQANIEKTKSMLLQHEVVLEDYGGDIQSVPISALKGENIDSLVEAILLQAEIMDLKGDPKGLCEGAVIESKHDTHRGKLATVLVQRGTLKKGKIIVAGIGWAKVRSMSDDNQQEVVIAEPSTAVEITGWRELPSAGDIVLEVESEKRARGVIDWRLKQKLDEKSQFDLKFIEEKKQHQQEAYKEQLLARRKLGRYKLKRTGPRPKEIPVINEGPKLSVIIKGDCDGSVEAIIDLLGTYRSSLCKLSVVHFEVGSVSLSDVELAEAFDAIIYAFNVDTLPDANDAAQVKEVPVRYHNIIYRLFEDMKNEMDDRLPLIEVSEVIGEAEVLQQFIITDGKKKVPVAGSKCTSGSLKKKGTVFKIVRENQVIHEGTIDSLRHLKNEVDVIKQDMDCGIRFTDTHVMFQPKDKIICLLYSKKKQVIDWNPGF